MESIDQCENDRMLSTRFVASLSISLSDASLPIKNDKNFWTCNKERNGSGFPDSTALLRVNQSKSTTAHTTCGNALTWIVPTTTREFVFHDASLDAGVKARV